MQKQINAINYFIDTKINAKSIEKFIDYRTSRKANEVLIIEKLTSIINEKSKIDIAIIAKSKLKETIKLIMTDQLLAKAVKENIDSELEKTLNLIQL